MYNSYLEIEVYANNLLLALQAQIKTIVQLNPGLSNDEVMQKCDTSKRRDRVVGFGGGIRARDLRGPALSKAELVSQLQASEQAKQVLEEKVNGMAHEVSEIKRLLSGRSLTDSSHERQHDQVSCSHTLVLFVIILDAIYLHGLTFIN